VLTETRAFEVKIGIIRQIYKEKQ